jgi:hypothetical protein
MSGSASFQRGAATRLRGQAKGGPYTSERECDGDSGLRTHGGGESLSDAADFADGTGARACGFEVDKHIEIPNFSGIVVSHTINRGKHQVSVREVRVE